MKPKAEGKENRSEPVKEVKEVPEMLGVHRCRSVSIVAAQGPKMGDTLAMENTRFNLIYG